MVKQPLLIHIHRHDSHARHVTIHRNPSTLLMHLHIRRILQTIAHLVFILRRFRLVIEGNHIVLLRIIKRNGFLRIVRNITSNGKRCLHDFLSVNKHLTLHRFLLEKFFPRILLQIADSIFQRHNPPMRIKGNIPCNLLRTNIIVFTILRCSVPTLKGIVLTGRKSRIVRILVFLYRLCIERFRCPLIITLESNSIGRSTPTCIKRQIITRHDSKRIAIRQLGIRLPSAPRIILSWCTRSIIVSSTGNVCTKPNRSSFLQFYASIIIGNSVSVTTIIKTIYIRADKCPCIRVLVIIQAIGVTSFSIIMRRTIVIIHAIRPQRFIIISYIFTILVFSISVTQKITTTAIPFTSISLHTMFFFL